MEVLTTNYNTKDALLKVFNENVETFTSSDSPAIAQMRKDAIAIFSKMGFPHTRLEKWRNTDLSSVLNHDFVVPLTLDTNGIDFDEVFRCEVPGFDTHLVAQLNGFFIDRGKSVPQADKGVIVCSMAEAFTRHRDIIEKHYGKYADMTDNSQGWRIHLRPRQCGG